MTADSGGSSNGRTLGFGPRYWGSNPYPPAKVYLKYIDPDASVGTIQT